MGDKIIDDLIEDINGSPSGSPALGRKNRGLTENSIQADNIYKRTLRNTPNINSKNQIEKIPDSETEIINNEDINDFKKKYFETFKAVLDNFIQDNEELCTKYPYMWYKRLLIELKQHVPAITYKEIDKCYIAWDALTWLMSSIGLYITVDTFYLFTGTYKKQFERLAATPKYAAFLEKIYCERDQALENEIAYNPYSQPNKMYLHKLHGFVEEGKTTTIEVRHEVRNFDNLPMFSQVDNN